MNLLQSSEEATRSGLPTRRLKDTSTVTIPYIQVHIYEPDVEHTGILAAFLVNEGYKMSPLLLSTV